MINQLAKETHDNAEAKGFNHKDIPRLLALVHSEVSEALEADRADQYYEPLRTILSDEQFYLRCLKGTFEDELADIMLRVMGIAHSRGIDLEFHIREKMKYNATRTQKHGGKKY